MHNSSANRAPSEEIHNVMHEYAYPYLGIVVSDLCFSKHPHILWYQEPFQSMPIF